MQKFLFVAICVIALYAAFVSIKDHKVSGELIPGEPYVHVYGRDTCGYTARMRQELRDKGVLFRYYRIDNPAVETSLHRRMQSAGLKTDRYRLPVVEVNRYMFIRPDIAEVMKRY